jgi:hypothetical protein
MKKQRGKNIKASTEAYEKEYSQDPQIHTDDLTTEVKSPENASVQTVIKNNPVDVHKVDDSSLSEPLKYVVSAPEAIEKVETLLEKVKESRPDLSNEVDKVLTDVDGLERAAWGEAFESHEATERPEPWHQNSSIGSPSPIDNSQNGMDPGTRVVVKTQDGEYTGVIESVNSDGTLEVLTDSSMKLSHVPAETVSIDKEGKSQAMSFPSNIRSKKIRMNSNRKRAFHSSKLKANNVDKDIDMAQKELELAKDLSEKARKAYISKKPSATRMLLDTAENAASEAVRTLDVAQTSVEGRKNSPIKGMGAGAKRKLIEKLIAKRKARNKAHNVLERLRYQDDPVAQQAIRAARAQFMAGTLDLRLMDAYHPAAQDEIRRLLADKSLKLSASAFDKLDKLELGGGLIAKRGKEKDGQTVKTVVVVDKDGNEVAEYPDAFGDDTVTIIKLLRQLHNITDEDDKMAKESEKPLVLPDPEKSEKKPDEKDTKAKNDDELEAAKKNFEERLALVRALVAERVSKRYVVANQNDIDSLLMKGMGLEASMNEALKMAVDREVMRLLSMPDAELLTIRASLGSLKPRPIQVETQASNEGLTFMAGLQVFRDTPESSDSFELGAAFGSAFRRR